jgi:hypothetical protein
MTVFTQAIIMIRQYHLKITLAKAIVIAEGAELIEVLPRKEKLLMTPNHNQSLKTLH